MKKILLIFICLFLVGGCKNKELTLDDILKENNYIILDVRTVMEYNEGHVKGAINISHGLIDENINLDKDKTIIVYCRSGGRSAIAKEKLESFGYKVFDLGAYNSINLEKE